MLEKLLDGCKISSIGRKPLSERVYESLKVAIINGSLPPETKLTETEVATHMEVSATPVREAFRRLASEGFVTSIPWRGVVVQGLADKEILETYQCREALEGLATRLAVENIDAEGIQKLRGLLQESEQVETIFEVVELNSAIHNLIIGYANNQKLKGMLGLFYDMILRHRDLTAYSTERRCKIHAEHVEIVDALEARDLDRAEKAMRTHVKNGLAYIVQQL